MTRCGDAFADVPVQIAAATKVRANPASFDDHFSQARLFWQSMSPVEQEHIVRAYTFELGKCYEQAIKERQLQCLANIDPALCAEVASGAGPARAVSRPMPLDDGDAEPGAVAGRRRVAGRRPDGRHRRRPRRRPRRRRRGLRLAVFAAGMVPLLIAPHGGMVGDLPVQRTFATGRSVEFDVLLLAGRAGTGARRAGRARRQGGRRRTRRRRPAGAAAGRGVLAARQGDRRAGAPAPTRAGAGRRRRARPASSRRAPAPTCPDRGAGR